MFKSYEQIMAELLADLPSTLTDKLPGSLTYTLLAVVARSLRMVWFMLEQLLSLFFVSSSKGSFLERRCAERGVIRKLGTTAHGKVNLTRSTPAPIGTTLTKGTLLATLDGKIIFTVDNDISLPAGWTTILADVTCTTIGITGNLSPATPLQVVGAQVVGVQNIKVGTGGLIDGTDNETDEQLRARYIFTIQNPQNGGTPADYIVWAMEVRGVTNAISIPLNRGNGTIDVVITNGGIPSNELVDSVSAHIKTKSPVGANVQVIKPVPRLVVVAGTIIAAQGFTIDGLTPLVKQAIDSYVRNVPIGGVVRITGLIQAILSVKGVFDFVMSAPTSNITLNTIELAIFDQG
ncbi:baseplate J/gp47 family protein [Paenibacillus planticolens]|uniref:Baseplate protein J-like domain-containing protein n=1 Tax=Paenibacillus planticolens TaxID=2654976 RepID=A0ABX1ZR99_9BACL|nr:baseplate J/gp47 family protein [Paenibacillus planticolens]NOV01339.1 hypothetical protein [Paenibacillus planticolens]